MTLNSLVDLCKKEHLLSQCWRKCKIVPASVEIGVDVHQAAKYSLPYDVVVWIRENYFHTSWYIYDVKMQA